MDLAVFTQQVVNALTLGSIYALIALGYTMVYGIIELINFAHGDVFMVGAFVSLWILTVPLGVSGPNDNWIAVGTMLLPVLLITMVFMGVVGITIERFAYRPLRTAPRLAPLITAIGVSFILQNIIQILFGPSPRNYPQVISFDNRIDIFGAQVRYLSIIIMVITVLLIVGLQLFINRTSLGRAMRSTAQDREAAALMGVDINRTIAATFFIGSALAGAAGMVHGLYFGSIIFNLGFFAGLKAFTAAVLGGIGNTTGAALGGYLIGFVEVGAAALGYARWSEALIFAVLVIVLVFRPTGLLGQQLGERA
jgi:branched-chain amino acid transport system permease protein